MDRAEFERMKEEEKKHLRELKALKSKLKEVEQKKKVVDALKGVGLPESVQDTHDEMVNRLNRSAIEQEAKMEIALEGAGFALPQVPVVDEETLQKNRAAELIKQMKLEMGGLGLMPETASPSTPAASDGEKTIGRLRTEFTEEEEDREKSIGRKKGI